METIKQIRINGILYELVPTEHLHKISDIEDFTNDLSTYDNSKSGFITSDALKTKQNKVLFGTTEPTDDIGEDGDIYFLLEE